MRSDFRQRVLLPILLPLGVMLAILAFAVSLSRVLLTVDHNLAVLIALGVAGYVLLLAFMIERRPRITSRALAVGTALGLLAVVGAGVAGAVAGPRPIEEEAAAGEGGEGAAGGEPGAAGEGSEIPEGAVVFRAGDELVYSEAPTEMPAGESTVALELTGLPHNVVFEGVNNDQPVVEGTEAGVYTGTVTLEPGEQVYYCSIPGHREAGMEGTVTVS